MLWAVDYIGKSEDGKRSRREKGEMGSLLQMALFIDNCEVVIE